MADLTKDEELVNTVESNEADTIKATHHEDEEEQEDEENGIEKSKASTLWSGIKIGALATLILLILGYYKYKR